MQISLEEWNYLSTDACSLVFWDLILFREKFGVDSIVFGLFFDLPRVFS
jgi:hypothetical protein